MYGGLLPGRHPPRGHVLQHVSMQDGVSALGGVAQLTCLKAGKIFVLVRLLKLLSLL
jgi:hypothetical protein